MLKILPSTLFLGLFLLSACKSTVTMIESDSTIIQIAQKDRNFDELEALYWARIDSSRMHFVQADVDFMSDMIIHHAQALIMSRLAPTNHASQPVQTLAARIINAQQDEIATMQKWLRDRGQSVPLVSFNDLVMIVEMEEPPKQKDHHRNQSDHSSHTMSHSGEPSQHGGHTSHSMHNDEAGVDHSFHQMSDDMKMDHTSHESMNSHSMSHHHDMPGMLTQEQLDFLATLDGTEFDRYFLTYMIEHHKGAVYMVNELFAADGAANDEESYRLAVDIYAEQKTEIEMMKLMLADIPTQESSTKPSHQPAHHQH